MELDPLQLAGLVVVRHASHRVSVVYRGDIVETGPAATVTSTPEHPYTQRLLLLAAG